MKYLQGECNDYTPPPAPHCIRVGCLPSPGQGKLWWPGLPTLTTQEDPGTGKSVAVLGQPEEMKPMTNFTDKDVLNNDPSSPWKKMIPSRGAMEEEEKLQKAVGAWGQEQDTEDLTPGLCPGHPYSRVSLVIPSAMVSVTTSVPAAPSQQTVFARVLEPQGELTERRPAWLPGFQEIAQSLREGNTPNHGQPPLREDTHVTLSPVPMAVDCPRAMLEDINRYVRMKTVINPST